MLHVGHCDYETGDMVLVGPCGDITFYDIPRPKSQATWWARYYRHVIDTGEDELNQLILPDRTIRRNERWQVAFWDSVIGVHFHARRNGRGEWLHGGDLPRHVLDYMLVREDLLPTKSVMERQRIRNIKELREYAVGVEFGKRKPYSLSHANLLWCWVTIQHEEKRPVLASALKKAARKAFQQEIKTWEEMT
jgi:hypothetical protein